MELHVQQLSWTDDMMLRAERPETPMQIQMLLIYDPSTAPGGRVTFKGILEEIDARLHVELHSPPDPAVDRLCALDLCEVQLTRPNAGRTKYLARATRRSIRAVAARPTVRRARRRHPAAGRRTQCSGRRR